MRRFILAIAIAVVLSKSPAGAATSFTWDTLPGTVGVGNGAINDGSGTWSTSGTLGNWTSDGGAHNIAWASTLNDVATFGGPTGNLGGTVTVSGNFSAGGILFNGSDSGNYLLAGTSSPTLTIGGSGITAQSGAGSETLGSTLAISLNGAQTWTNNSANVLAVNSNIGGTGALSFAGTGGFALNATNTYTGGTNINAGTVTAGADNVLGPAGLTNGPLTMANIAGATFNVNGKNVAVGSLAGGGANGGNITLNTTTTNNGLLTFGYDNSNQTFAGNITTTTVTSIENPPVGLVKVGTGKQTFTGNNNVMGMLSVDGGGGLAVTAGTTNIYYHTSTTSPHVQYGGTIVIGANSPNNTLEVKSGGKLIGFYNFQIGTASASFGNTVIVDGVGSQLNNSNTDNVGTLSAGNNNFWVGVMSSHNSVTISGGATVNLPKGSGTNDQEIGSNTGADFNSLTVTGGGSSFTTGSLTKVGLNGSNNTMTVSAGASAISYKLQVGVGTGTNNGIIVTGSGSLYTVNALAPTSDQLSNAQFSIGVVPGANGNYMSIESGGTFNFTGSGNSARDYSIGAVGNNNFMRITGANSTVNVSFIEPVGIGGIVNGTAPNSGTDGGTGNHLDVANGGNLNLKYGSGSASLYVMGSNSAFNLGDGNALSSATSGATSGIGWVPGVYLKNASGTLNFNNGTLIAGTAGTLVSGPGNIVLNGPGYISTSFASGSTISSVITGTSGNSLVKQGTGGILVLTADNTYAGNTVVQAGTLNLTPANNSSTNNIPNSAIIVVGDSIAASNTAVFDVSNVNGSGAKFHVASGQSLGGFGSVTGNVTIDGKLAPNNIGGQLTFNSPLTLSGTSESDFIISPSGNDLAAGIGSNALNKSGKLKVLISGSPTFTIGETFTLFSSFAQGGAFTSFDMAALPTGLAWHEYTPGYYFDNSTGKIMVEAAAPGISAGNGTWRNGANNGLWTTHSTSGNNWSGGFPSAVNNIATFDGNENNYSTGNVSFAGLASNTAIVGGVDFNTGSATSYTLGGSSSDTLQLSSTTTAFITAESGTGGGSNHTIKAKVQTSSNSTITAKNDASLALDGGLDNSAGKNVALTQQDSGTLSAASITNNGTGVVTLKGDVAVTGAVSSSTGNTGTLNVGTAANGSATLSTQRIVQSALNIGRAPTTADPTPSATVTINASTPSDYFSPGDSVVPTGNSSGTSILNSLSIANDGSGTAASVGAGNGSTASVYYGKLDLMNNNLVIDYTGTTASVPSIVDSVRGAIQSAFGTGNWSGLGLTSSMAATPPSGRYYALALMNNNDAAHNHFPSFNSFEGTPVSLTSILVKFTWQDDMNLDGTVDGNDASLFAQQYDNGATTGHTFATGDLNYDGIVDGNDASIFAQHYVNFEPAFKLANLPEPSSFLLAGLGLVGLLVARRRKSK